MKTSSRLIIIIDAALFLYFIQQSQLQMDSQSTTKSVTIDLSNNFGEAERHLINTTKVLRGHKLKTQDFIRLQLMRFRFCSPIKYEDQIEQNIINMNKTTEFGDKYRGFDCDGDQKQLHHIIINQREKQSRQTAKRMKFLHPFKNQQQNREEKMPFYNTQFTIKVKPATSHERRTVTDWKKLNKTISFNKTQIGLNQQKPSKLHFISHNLGERMNDYMNQMIEPSPLPQNLPIQLHKRQPTRQPNSFQSPRIDRNATRQKKSQNAYLKQMKKRFKSKYAALMQNSKQIHPFQQIQTKNMQNIGETYHNSMNTIMKSGEQPIFYSMQLQNQIKDSPQCRGLSQKSKNRAQKITQYNQMSNSIKLSKQS